MAPLLPLHPVTLLLVLSFLTPLAHSARVMLPPNPTLEIDRSIVIVQLHEQPTVKGGSLPTIGTERASFLNRLGQSGIVHSVRRKFSLLLNAVSLKIQKTSDAYAISAFPEVKCVSYAQVFRLPKNTKQVLSHSAVQKIAASGGVNLKPEHIWTNVTQVQQVLNVTGAGVKVGIIDTGIDYKHPAFGACSRIGPPCRVAYGYDFAGEGEFAGPDYDPFDCNGHGTHVAGIVGAKDNFTMGVAPDVILGAYKVFACFGADLTTAIDDDVISAMETAAMDGMDIINLSFGQGATWPQAPTALAADAATSQGLVVFSSAGDHGDYGLWQVETPGLSSRGFGVASVDNADVRAFQVVPSGQSVAFTFDKAYQSYYYFQDGVVSISQGKDNATIYGCQTYSQNKFNGVIALIKQGLCSITTKARNAQKAGAIGVIVYNNVSGALNFTLDNIFFIPVVGISLNDGVQLAQSSSTTTQTVHWLFSLVPTSDPGQVSSFSSWGLSPDLTIKPDIAAPGGNIVSTYPLQYGGYILFSGTSLGAPYAAGVAALFRAAKKRKVTSDEVKLAILNGAVPVRLRNGLAASVASQGAGLLNALNTIQGSTSVTPASLQLGFFGSNGTPFTKTITVINTGNSTMNYSASLIKAVTIDATASFIITNSSASVAVTVSPVNFTVAPYKNTTIKVNFTLPTTGAGQLLLLSGFIKLTPLVSNPKYSPVHVPFSALKGDPAAYQIQNRTGIDWFTGHSLKLPCIVDRFGNTYDRAAQNVTFTFNWNTYDYPSFAMLTLRPASSIALRLYEASTDRLMGYIDFEEYVGVTGPDISYSLWKPPSYMPAVKKTNSSKVWIPVPDGTYYVNMTTTAPSQISKKAVEVWKSPKIILKTH